MKRIVKWIGIALSGILIVAIALFVVAFNYSFVSMKTTAYDIPVQTETTWETIFSEPQPITFEILETGKVHGDLFTMLESDSPNIDKIEDRYSPMDVPAFWLKHPEIGDILIDTGLNDSFRLNPPTGDYPLILSIMFKSMDFKIIQEEGEDLGSQLIAKNITPQIVFLTHLHPDHITALPQLPKDIEVVFGPEEISFMAMSSSGKYLRGMKNLKTIDWSDSMNIAPFEKVIDLLGDGSLWAISTCGHSEDHISYLVNTESGPLFLTGDCLGIRLELEYEFEYSMEYSEEVQQQIDETLNDIRYFATNYPQVQLVLSHDLEKEY